MVIERITIRIRRLPKEGPWMNKSLISYSSVAGIIIFIEFDVLNYAEFISFLPEYSGRVTRGVIQG